MPTGLYRRRRAAARRRTVAGLAVAAAGVAGVTGTVGCAGFDTPSARHGRGSASRALNPEQLREVAAMFEAQGKGDRAGALLAAAGRREGRPPLPSAAQPAPPAAVPAGPLMLAAAPAEPEAPTPKAAAEPAAPPVRRVDVAPAPSVASAEPAGPADIATGAFADSAGPVAAIETAGPETLAASEPLPPAVAPGSSVASAGPWTLAGAFVADPAAPVEAEDVTPAPAGPVVAAAIDETVEGPGGEPLALFPDDLFAAADVLAADAETDGWDAVTHPDLLFAEAPPAETATGTAGEESAASEVEVGRAAVDLAEPAAGRAAYEGPAAEAAVRPVAASKPAGRASFVTPAVVEAPVVLFPHITSDVPPTGRASVE